MMLNLTLNELCMYIVKNGLKTTHKNVKTLCIYSLTDTTSILMPTC